MALKCKVCGDVATHIWRCDEHYSCDDCGEGEGLVYRTEGLLCEPCHTARVNKRMENFNGKTSYTSEIICPHCGYQFQDCWEYSSDYGSLECPDCENDLTYEREIEVTYTTVKEICNE
jgi:hypothetical protein